LTSRRHFLRTAAASALTARAAATPPANIVVILVDDLGWRDVGFNGTRFYSTPHIDALAAAGMKFPHAYAAAPVCAPSRAAILTGRSPARLGLTSDLPVRHDLPFSKVLPPPSKAFLPLEEKTIAEELQSAGYISAAIGKWHVGGPRYYPERQGFDINVAGTDSGEPRSQFYPQWNGNPPITAKQGECLADALTDAAEDFIQRYSDRPFFLWLSHYAVHAPLEADPGVVGIYRRKIDPKDRQNNPVYAAMIETVDTSVGRVVKRLADAGVADRTAIFFLSDNGGNASATSNAPLKAGKGFLYEGGIRVPMCIVWPGATKPGATSNTPVIGTDIYPTIAEMAGIKRLTGSPADGVSLAPLLRGGPAPKRDALLWHYPHYSPEGGRPGRAIRMGDWKLIQWYEDNATELYNLTEDPGEAKNVATAQPAKAKELQASLESIQAPRPKPNPAYDPEQETVGLSPAIRAQLTSGTLPTPAK